MMIRTFLALLIAGSFTLAARASDPISVPAQAASASVTQPHVTAELIPEIIAVQAGQPFDVALHLHADPGWHTYWINPGDAGLATMIKWTLPLGFTAGPILWPTPEKHSMGPLVTYGYGGDVYLLTTITPPKDNLPQHFDIKAKASWLVCAEECIPGKAEFTLSLDSGLMNLKLPVDNKDFFDEARARLPVEGGIKLTIIAGRGNYEDLGFHSDSPISPKALESIQYFPVQANVFSNTDKVQLAGTKANEFTLTLTRQQNGDTPTDYSGVLVSDQPLVGNANAISIHWAPPPANGMASTPALSAFPAAAASPAAEGTRAQPATTPSEAPPLLIAVLGAAFIGGLILNLMPCVLPVLSLKVFSLMKHAGENPKAAWLQGVAFTVGVVLSFWVLAGLLIALRTAGNHIGWGFQMQNPGFVLALIFIFFLLALNLFGVFELGSSLVGLDAKATGHLGGLASSFGNGALATVAATPCTAPFMGSALGFAAQQSPFISLLVFTFVALGMSAPYLLLTLFPGALRFVPKPGAWMEAFKQFMGFLLMATAVWLLPVYGSLAGQKWLGWVLFALLFAGMSAWIYGRWGTLRAFCFLIFAGLALYALKPMVDTWQPWSQEAVAQTLAKGRPVFVDFTADWCLSCKVNERVALGTDEVKRAFTDKNVALFRADWTHSDPAISQALQKYNRDGVPLYLLYSPKTSDSPHVLPEVLTPGIVLDALKNL